MTVSVDPVWLSSTKRLFPVVIDPSVVLSGTALDTDAMFQVNCATCTPTMGTSTDHLTLGNDDSGNSWEVASRFDTSSVPGGSKILGATLTANFDHCYPEDSYPDPSVGCSWVWPWQSLTLDAHRITAASWGSSTQTQNLTYDSSVVATDAFTLGYPSLPGIGPGTPLSWDVSSLVQQWSSAIQPNNGIVLVNSQPDCGSFSSSPCGVRIEDSSYATASLRPSLKITYTPTLGVGSQYPMWRNGPVAVNEATGNLVISAPGPSFPTEVGTLSLPVTYNSLNTSTAGSNPFGTGWTAGPSSWLIDHGALGDALSIEQFFGDGSSVVFNQIESSGIYQAQDGSNSLLMRNPAGSDPAFTVTSGDGSVWSYRSADSSTGYAQLEDLETLAAGSGTGLVSYSFNGSGQLQTVTAKNGSNTVATLSLTWGCTGAIVCVTGPDGQTWSYIGVSGGSGLLQTIDDGTHEIFKVSYDSSNRPQYIQNADDLSPPAGYDSTHKLTISYDSSNRVASVANGPVTGQTPSTSTWSFSYHPDLSGATTTDAVANSHGVSGQPDYVAAGTHRQTAGYTTVTPPCEQASGTCTGHSGSAQIKVYYDSFAQVMERVELPGTDSVAHITQTQYSATVPGQLQWAEDEQGNPSDYAYEPTDNTLSSVTAPDPDGAGPAQRPVSSYNYDETTYGSVSGGVYTPGAPLQGVQAAYYKTRGFVTTAHTGRPDAVETDVTSGSFSFSWGSTGPPALPGTTTNYSVRFVGDLWIPTGSTPTVEFETIAEGGTQLTVDTADLIENLTGTGTSTQTGAGTIDLAPGKHRFVLNYVEPAASPNSSLQLLYKCDANCGSLPTSFTGIPASALTPAWGNQTSAVSPTGHVAFSHYPTSPPSGNPASAAAGHPDYTLAKAPVNGSTAPLISYFTYDSLGRLIGKVMPNGNTSASIAADGTISSPGDPSTSDYGTIYSYYGDTATATTLRR